MTASPDPTEPIPPTAPDSPNYSYDGRASYYLRYYLHLVTRRRRHFFAKRAAAERLRVLMTEIAEGLDCRMVRCTVCPSTVTIEIEAPPTISPHSLSHRLRADAAGPLLEEFEHIRRAGSVFVRQYIVSTAPIPEADCDALEQGISTG